MSDYTIMIKNKAKVFLADPPLVKMATNEIVDDETLVVLKCIPKFRLFGSR
ncbi:MAG: hypothetical protein IPN09_16800 [Bacteroidetes bacterium]|nr:hypothetical protein [Bacteroidota bacterium]